MKKGFSKLMWTVCAAIMAVTCFGGLVGCGSNPISNESTRLVIGTQELDGVFNPFYSSSAPDSNIVAMTQIGMLNTDKDGNIVCGQDEACLVFDYESVPSTDGLYTTYRFALKNDVKFSNGTPVTMKDVLFNLYEYLDPMYYGSATVYSTDIVGLSRYRTQQESDNLADQFEDQFIISGTNRLQNLDNNIRNIFDRNKDKVFTDEEMIAELGKLLQLNPNNATLVEDYEQVKIKLDEVMAQTWSYSVGTAEDIKYVNSEGKEVHLDTDTEAFLYNWGFITWNEKDKVFENTLAEDAKNWDKETLFERLRANYIPNNIREVIGIYASAELLEYFTALEKQKYLTGLGDKIVRHVEGITFANLGKDVKVNGTTYPAINKDTDYNTDGSLKVDNKEVLEIKINKVDPKAIFNFSFSVAPMYYYSNSEEIAKFDYENHFGVAYSDRSFQDNVIKDPNKIGLPVGAGPYKATTNTGDSEHVTASEFKSHNVVYFERNENFMFPVNIKYVNYQVVPEKLMLDSLYSGSVHYVEPSANKDKIASLNSRNKDGFSYNAVMTNGYGYVGINASKVPDINVRKAIMHAINTQRMVDYYIGYSQPIVRPMTRASWAYPKEADAKGQYYAFDDSGDLSKALLAGYTASAKKNDLGVPVLLDKFGNPLSYKFTIAGDSVDHPAYNALFRASQILNQIGFDVEVVTDINALRKLNSGALTVWAAAWSSTIDPDMYQVYHKDSTAGAVKNWGYDSILNPANRTKYATEYNLIQSLSKLIDKGRTTLEQDGAGGRKEIYAQALDMVMELAVELPGYQRSDLFAYNTNMIDVNTLTKEDDLSPYNGPIAKIWELSLKESK